MLVWIASYSRSGNTFFRVVLTRLYDVQTYAAFDAGEPLVTAGAQNLVNHASLPEPLRAAMARGDNQSPEVKAALEKLDDDEQVYVFKTHGTPEQLFGIAGKTVLLVRDGRDSLASFANFFIDIGADLTAVKFNLKRTLRRPLSPRAWLAFGKEAAVAAFKGVRKRAGMRERMVSLELDRLLRSGDDTYLNWNAMNRAWLNFEPRPVIVHFDDLVRDPVATVTGAVEALGLDLPTKGDQQLPSFEELKAQYPNFFRKGETGDWKRWFSDRQQQKFWEGCGDTMRELGFQA